MTDLTKLKELAERATPGPWVRTVDGVMPETGHSLICCAWGLHNMSDNLEFIAAANPQAILGLISQIEGLERLIQGRWREEVDRLTAENEALRGALQAVHAEVDGNIRPLTRDLVNMVSGVKTAATRMTSTTTATRSTGLSTQPWKEAGDERP